MIEKKLESGLYVVINNNGGYIKYGLEVVDTRYGKSEFRINYDEIDLYIQAFKNNFYLYMKLKEEGKKEIVKCEMNMTIRFGIYEGVCIKDHYFSIRTKKKLNMVINDLEYAKKQITSYL